MQNCYQAAPNVNIHKKTVPANWFAIPTLLDNLLTVLLHMTYLNMSPIFLQNYLVHVVYNGIHKGLIN